MPRTPKVVIADTPTGESTSEDVDVKTPTGDTAEDNLTNSTEEPGKPDSEEKVLLDANFLCGISDAW